MIGLYYFLMALYKHYFYKYGKNNIKHVANEEKETLL